MEPVTIIVAALVAAVAKLAEPAVNDAYEGLKRLIKRKFAGEQTVEVTVDNLQISPEVWRAPLQEALKKVKASQDAEIMIAVEKLKKAIEASPAQVTQNTAHAGDGSIAFAGHNEGNLTVDNRRGTQRDHGGTVGDEQIEDQGGKKS